MAGSLGRRLGVVGIVAVLGCADEREDSAGQSASLTADPSASLDDGASASGPAGSSAVVDDSNDDESGNKLDVGGGTGMNEGGDDGVACNKVDLVFVIDGSGSMADEQAGLLSAFPGFIDTMRNELDSAMGYNIGVVRTDSNDISCVANRYGVLVTRNFTAGSSNATCTPYASGGRYMTQDDDLVDKFTCAAKVGVGGDGDERPMQALIAALTSPNIDAGECNEGFLRDDALLVIVIITDEEDDHETEQEACGMTPSAGSDGDPDTWFDAIVATKGGIETNIVVLSLVGTAAPDQCPDLDKCNGGIDGAEQAPNLLAFTWSFTHGHVGPVCSDYGPFFQEAVADIKDACEGFVPPG